MTSINCNFWKNLFELINKKWSGDGPQNKRTSKHILDTKHTFIHILPQTWLVIRSWPFLLLITNSIKNKVKSSEDF